VKGFAILGAVVALMAISLGATAVPAIAGGPAGTPAATTVTVNWLEDAVRYAPDGTVLSSWTNDSIGPVELAQTGKAYHIVDIGEFYNTTLPDISGSLVISGAGKLSGHATYTSLYSGLPVRERFNGDVKIDAETMVGTYTQWSYAFGTKEEVHAYYPYAVAGDEIVAGEAGWWYLGYTIYTAHGM
jgi:hypothetical protein